MESVSELWVEGKFQNSHEILGSIIRDELKKEKVYRIDFSYVGNQINQWWKNRNNEDVCELTHSSLKLVILDALKLEHLECIRNVGSSGNHVSAVLLEHSFNFVNKDLALLVHEVMSEIAGIVDIKYPYEDHKELFPKANGKVATEWGRGLGIIRPHSDDLYEDFAISTMCLTVCKDTSSTPTWFWMLKDIVACLTDEELGEFLLSEAIFISGTNVKGKVIEVKKAVLRRDPIEGIGMRMDFRIDEAVGPRMRFLKEAPQRAFDKMRLALRNLKPICSRPTTGSVSILSNYKVLHGRSALNPVMLYEGESSRILFRSKGTKQENV